MMFDLEENLNRNIDFIKQADTKAAFISTILLAITSYLLANLDADKLIKSGWLIMALVLCVIAFLATLYFILKGVHPVTKEKITKTSLIYYGTIAIMDLETFKKKRSRLNDNDVKDFLIDQIYVTSVIVNSKMRSVQRAFYSLLIFAVLSLIHVGVLSVAL